MAFLFIFRENYKFFNEEIVGSIGRTLNNFRDVGSNPTLFLLLLPNNR